MWALTDPGQIHATRDNTVTPRHQTPHPLTPGISCQRTDSANFSRLRPVLPLVSNHLGQLSLTFPVSAKPVTVGC